MKMFLDTANVAELREGVAMGLVDGGTTNPSLIAKGKRAVRPLLEEICFIVPGDVSLEVVAADCEGIMIGSDTQREAQFRTSNPKVWFKSSRGISRHDVVTERPAFASLCNCAR